MQTTSRGQNRFTQTMKRCKICPLYDREKCTGLPPPVATTENSPKMITHSTQTLKSKKHRQLTSRQFTQNLKFNIFSSHTTRPRIRVLLHRRHQRKRLALRIKGARSNGSTTVFDRGPQEQEDWIRSQKKSSEEQSQLTATTVRSDLTRENQDHENSRCS